MTKLTPEQIINAVAANRMNWVKAKNLLKTMPDFASNNVKLGEAVDAAEAARNASDGYMRSES